MPSEIERRRHPRVDIQVPIAIMTPDGPIDGQTQNLSLVGAFIRCPRMPELDNHFRLVIKIPEGQLLLATAKMIWSDVFYRNQSLFHGIGLCFKYMVDEDRQSLSRMLNYQPGTSPRPS